MPRRLKRSLSTHEDALRPAPHHVTAEGDDIASPETSPPRVAKPVASPRKETKPKLDESDSDSDLRSIVSLPPNPFPDAPQWLLNHPLWHPVRLGLFQIVQVDYIKNFREYLVKLVTDPQTNWVDAAWMTRFQDVLFEVYRRVKSAEETKRPTVDIELQIHGPVEDDYTLVFFYVVNTYAWNRMRRRISHARIPGKPQYIWLRIDMIQSTRDENPEEKWHQEISDRYPSEWHDFRSFLDTYEYLRMKHVPLFHNRPDMNVTQEEWDRTNTERWAAFHQELPKFNVDQSLVDGLHAEPLSVEILPESEWL